MQAAKPRFADPCAPEHKGQEALKVSACSVC